MQGGLKTYKYKEKNIWRRKAWKNVASRVSNKRNAEVVYLSGEEDIDRRLAVSYGFKAHNLFAVDQDLDVVKKLRREGKIALCGDIFEIADSFQSPSVIWCDLCCGLTEKVAVGIYALTLSMPFNTVFMFNFLRGRETGEIARNILDYAKGSIEANINSVAAYSKANGIDVGKPSDFFNSVHRGALAFYAMQLFCLPSLMRDRGYDHIKSVENIDNKHIPTRRAMYDLSEAFIKTGKPSLLSYKSSAGSQRFDTLIINHPLNFGNGSQLWQKKYSRQVAAARAVQTMRVNGYLGETRRY